MNDADARGKLTHPPVGAEFGVIRNPRMRLAVISKQTHLIGNGIVVGHDHTSLAAGHDFRREKRVRTALAKPAGPEAV